MLPLAVARGGVHAARKMVHLSGGCLLSQLSLRLGPKRWKPYRTHVATCGIHVWRARVRSICSLAAANHFARVCVVQACWVSAHVSQDATQDACSVTMMLPPSIRRFFQSGGLLCLLFERKRLVRPAGDETNSDETDATPLYTRELHFVICLLLVHELLLDRVP